MESKKIVLGAFLALSVVSGLCASEDRRYALGVAFGECPGLIVENTAAITDWLLQSIDNKETVELLPEEKYPFIKLTQSEQNALDFLTENALEEDVVKDKLLKVYKQYAQEQQSYFRYSQDKKHQDAFKSNNTASHKKKTKNKFKNFGKELKKMQLSVMDFQQDTTFDPEYTTFSESENSYGDTTPTPKDDDVDVAETVQANQFHESSITITVTKKDNGDEDNAISVETEKTFFGIPLDNAHEKELAEKFIDLMHNVPNDPNITLNESASGLNLMPDQYNKNALKAYNLLVNSLDNKDVKLAYAEALKRAIDHADEEDMICEKAEDTNLNIFYWCNVLKGIPGVGGVNEKDNPELQAFAGRALFAYLRYALRINNNNVDAFIKDKLVQEIFTCLIKNNNVEKNAQVPTVCSGYTVADANISLEDLLGNFFQKTVRLSFNNVCLKVFAAIEDSTRGAATGQPAAAIENVSPISLDDLRILYKGEKQLLQQWENALKNITQSIREQGVNQQDANLVAYYERAQNYYETTRQVCEGAKRNLKNALTEHRDALSKKINSLEDAMVQGLQEKAKLEKRLQNTPADKSRTQEQQNSLGTDLQAFQHQEEDIVTQLRQARQELKNVENELQALQLKQPRQLHGPAVPPVAQPSRVVRVAKLVTWTLVGAAVADVIRHKGDLRAVREDVKKVYSFVRAVILNPRASFVTAQEKAKLLAECLRNVTREDIKAVVRQNFEAAMAQLSLLKENVVAGTQKALAASKTGFVAGKERLTTITNGARAAATTVKEYVSTTTSSACASAAAGIAAGRDAFADYFFGADGENGDVDLLDEFFNQDND